MWGIECHIKSSSETSVSCTLLISNHSFYTFPFILESCFLLSMLLPLWRLSPSANCLETWNDTELFFVSAMSTSLSVRPNIVYLSKTHSGFTNVLVIRLTETDIVQNIVLFFFYFLKLNFVFSYVCDDEHSQYQEFSSADRYCELTVGQNISCGV